MEQAFGIDLGTTNSCIAVICDDGLPQVIKNLEDKFTTPSVVYFGDDGEQYVGEEAKNVMGEDPSRSVAFIKREMTNKDYRVNIDGKSYSPVDISARILKKVVDDANTQRGMDGLPPIHKAVITVPAYFGLLERQLTKQAGEMAGLEVLDLLNEPTAAALSYGAKGLEGKTFIVYDLGGGTFDVSIMRMQNDKLDTLATDGDHHLGGVDWDIELLDFMLGMNDIDERYDDIKETRDGAKGLLAAEICKKNLTKTDKAALKLMYKRRPYLKDVSRSVFEELTSTLLDSTVNLMKHALTLCKEPNVHIDEIILVGGSSYMPMVKNRLTKEFNCPIRLDNLEPDRAVAKGAAIYAAQLLGDKSSKTTLGEDKGSRSYGLRTNVIDGNGESIGIRVANLIKRTDPIVFEYHSEDGEFYTPEDGMTNVSFAIYENISDQYHVELEKSTLLKDGVLNWGCPVPKGTSVNITVKRGSDGIIHFYGRCMSGNIEVDIQPEGVLSDSEVKQKRNELKDQRF